MKPQLRVFLLLCMPLLILPLTLPSKRLTATRALIQAVESRDYCSAQQAVLNGADVNNTNDEGISLIMVAADYGDLDTLKLLQDAKAQTNLNEKLIIACELDQVEVVKRLLREGASVNAKDHQGDTALCYAAAHNHGDIIRVLLRHGADAKVRSEQGRTAFDWASEFNNAYALALLQKHLKKKKIHG